jgi:hypothetical protein
MKNNPTQCPVCKNKEFNKNGECLYCIWKGTIGPGAVLKKIIKEVNDKNGK